MSESACPRCGTRNGPKDRFCVKCGTPLKETAVADHSSRSRKTQRANSNIVFLIAGVAFVGVAIVLGLNLLNANSPRVASPTNEIEDVHDEQGIPYPNVPRIELAGAKAQYDAKNAVFVDVRGKSDYDSAHIPGAISLPLSEIEVRYTELPRDREILTYCT